MEKEFIPYEQALVLKELGFNEPCFGYFNDEGIFYYTDGPWNATKEKGMMFHPTSSPTFSQSFRWFREKHDLDGTIIRNGGMNIDERGPLYFYGYHIYQMSNSKIGTEYSHEEAELACLKKLIEIIKTKK